MFYPNPNLGEKKNDFIEAIKEKDPRRFFEKCGEVMDEAQHTVFHTLAPKELTKSIRMQTSNAQIAARELKQSIDTDDMIRSFIRLANPKFQTNGESIVHKPIEWKDSYKASDDVDCDEVARKMRFSFTSENEAEADTIADVKKPSDNKESGKEASETLWMMDEGMEDFKKKSKPKRSLKKRRKNKKN